MRRDLINFFSRFKESYYNKLIFSSITVLAGPVHIFYPAAAFTVNFFFFFLRGWGVFQIHARWQHRLSQTASICLQEFVSLLYHYCKRWARACTVLHLSRRLTRGDRRLGSAPLHSGPFIHGSLISQSLCFNSEDEKCLYVPYLHCFCSDLLYSFNVLVSLIIAILKLLAVLSTLNNGELFIESASVNTHS